MRGARLKTFRDDERGYTLPEILTAVAISGVLAAIAVIIFLALLERWRVEAAADQLAADMRLAHSKATQGLTDWRVVLVPENAVGSDPDYYLVRLGGVYEKNYPKPAVVSSEARSFPANVKVRNHRSETSNDKQDQERWVSPLMPGHPGPAPQPTRSVEFNSDGTMAFFKGPANAACITIDGNPMLKVEAHHPGTSNIQIAEGEGKPCSVD